MTRPEIIVVIVAAICTFVIVVQYIHARHEIAKHGQAEFERGWLEGWDDREHDHHPDTPEPKGRHHGISQPKDWTEEDLTEFLPGPPPVPEIIPGVQMLPPLPKRIPGATQ